MQPATHTRIHPSPGALIKADEISKEHQLGKFFSRKLRIDAAKMHRLDPEEMEVLNNMAAIYARAMAAVNGLGKHSNLTELLTKASLAPIPDPVTLNAIEYLCHKNSLKESELDKALAAKK